MNRQPMMEAGASLDGTAANTSPDAAASPAVEDAGQVAPVQHGDDAGVGGLPADRRASAFLGRWEGTSKAGVRVVVDINEVDDGSGPWMSFDGYASAEPCIAKSRIVMGSIFFGDKTRTLMYPEFFFKASPVSSDGSFRVLVFDGTSRVDGIDGLMTMTLHGAVFPAACAEGDMELRLARR